MRELVEAVADWPAELVEEHHGVQDGTLGVHDGVRHGVKRKRRIGMRRDAEAVARARLVAQHVPLPGKLAGPERRRAVVLPVCVENVRVEAGDPIVVEDENVVGLYIQSSHGEVRRAGQDALGFPPAAHAPLHDEDLVVLLTSEVHPRDLGA